MQVNHSFRVPKFSDIHQTVLAFLRTSEFGVWQANAETPSDVFVLNLRRGAWKSGWFSGGKLVPNIQERMRSSDIPMRLTVSFRPSSDTIRLGLQFTIELGRGSSSAAYFCRQYAADETTQLMVYLRDFYQLPKPLCLDTDCDDGP